MTIELPHLTVCFRFSFFAVLTVMLLFCDANVTALCLVSSLLHEGGHLAVMALVRTYPQSICFGAGGIVIERARPGGKWEEFAAALGGVALNAVLCLGAFLSVRLTGSVTARMFFWVNALLLLFNLLPVRQLDLYTALCAVFPGQTRCFKRISDVTTVLLFVATIVYFIKISVNPSLAAACACCAACNGFAGERSNL